MHTHLKILFTLFFECQYIYLCIGQQSHPKNSRIKYVAIVTGGARGIGKGITEALVESGKYDGILITYNTNSEAAESLASTIMSEQGTPTSATSTSATTTHRHHRPILVKTVGGDLSTVEARDRIFEVYDQEFPASLPGTNDHDDDDDDGWCLGCIVHNAGQYIGVTSENADQMEQEEEKKMFGSGSLLVNDGEGTGDRTDFSHLRYYQKLYGEAFIDVCERGLVRMKAARDTVGKDRYRGSIIGISSPGCNAAFRVTPGYDMPGSGKCIMEFAARQYALMVAPMGINCNIIVPGFTKSDAWERIAHASDMPVDQLYDTFSDTIPAREYAEPKDIGDLVAFLSSRNGGGRFMTGLSLRCDGGRHLM